MCGGGCSTTSRRDRQLRSPAMAPTVPTTVRTTGEAIVDGLLAHGVVPAALTDIAEVPGNGITGMLDGAPVGLASAPAGGSRLACELTVGGKRATIEFRDELRPGNVLVRPL